MPGGLALKADAAHMRLPRGLLKSLPLSYDTEPIDTPDRESAAVSGRNFNFKKALTRLSKGINEGE
jgi:hypothetical protein